MQLHGLVIRLSRTPLVRWRRIGDSQSETRATHPGNTAWLESGGLVEGAAMDVRQMRAAAWVFASAAVLATAAGAAVIVARPAHPDLRPVADRVHAFTVRVAARAY